MAFRAILVLLLAAASACASAQSVPNGMLLYQSTCNSCHGTPPFGGPELAPNNPALIKQAITSLVPSMFFLRGMYSDAQLADIAAYIASLQSSAPPPPPPGPPVPQFDYTDLWYNPNESGWGFNVVQHMPSNNIFGVIYTYEAPNRPDWYVLPGGAWTTSSQFSGALYHVNGSPATAAFKAGVVTQVGTATLVFSDANTGQLIYTVNGTQVVKSFQRQPY